MEIFWTGGYPPPPPPPATEVALSCSFGRGGPNGSLQDSVLHWLEPLIHFQGK